MNCPDCDNVLASQEIADGWCESCGKRLPPSILEAARARPGREDAGPRAKVDLERICLLCREEKDTGIYFLLLAQVTLVNQRKITRGIHIRARCCASCHRRLRFSNQTRWIRNWLNVLLLAGLFFGYCLLIPRLLENGVPGVVVGFGSFVPILIAIAVWRFLAGQGWQGMLAPQTIELFKASGIGWDANLMSSLLIAREPFSSGAYLDLVGSE